MAEEGQNDVPLAAEGDEVLSNIGLRRSKRNKYHLNVLDVLRSGTSSHRDYSPPTKKWATRRPEPAYIAPTQHPKTASPAKRNVKKEVAPITGDGGSGVETVVEQPKEVGEKPQTQSLETKLPEEKKKEDEARTNEVVLRTGGLQNLDIQLPDQILEEDDFITAPLQETNQIIVETAYSGNECAEAATSSSSMALSVEGQFIKRKRKVPLRHLDYTNGEEESDMDEDKLFKEVKVEYMLTDGSRAADEHSCPKCPAIFESRVGLTNHLKLHGAKKSFPCELCDFSCTNKKTMRQHRRVHGLCRRQGGGKTKPIENIVQQLAMAATAVEEQEVIEPNEEPRREIKHELNIGEEEEEVEEKFIVVKSLDEINALEKEAIAADQAPDYAEEDGGMPILEQQDGLPPNSSVVVVVDNSSGGAGEQIVAAVEKRAAMKAGRKRAKLPYAYCKKGSKMYDRNTVQCPYCPFKTQSKVRLEPHMAGHSRPSGFVCSICQFKSESSGILHRHCQQHTGASFKWPPDYLGSIPAVVSDGTDGGDLELEGGEAAAVAVDASSRRANDCEDRGRWESDSGGAEMEGGRAETGEKCWEGECSFSSRTKSDMFAHRWRDHREKFFPGLKQAQAIYKSSCLRCGFFFRSGPSGLALHNQRYHKMMNKTRKALCSDLLAERLSWNMEKKEERAPTEQQRQKWERRIHSNMIPGPHFSNTPSAINRPESPTFESPEKVVTEAETTSKLFHCRSCPYTTDQIFRLQKHENKHLVKAEHQFPCPHCTFSCRSMDILTQHMRLHDTTSCSSSNNNTPTTPKSASTSGSNYSFSIPLQPSKVMVENPAPPKLTSVRRNETHYCPCCPYKSKHNCDMKAHLKMHEERRKYTCTYCTYSTMRQNALIAHEKLHQIGNMEKGKCRRLKMIFYRGGKKMGGSKYGVILGDRMQLLGSGVHFYRCSVKKCSAEFPFCSELFQHGRHHLKNEWTANRGLGCAICGFRTSLEKRMRAHEAVHKGGEEKNIRSLSGVFNCKECPYATANYAKFWNHRQKHKRAARFACSFCSFSSGSIQCYNEHLELHNNGEGGIPKVLVKKDEKDASITSENEAKNASKCPSTNELPPIFKKDKYEQLNNAIPLAQLKIMGALGKPFKESDSRSISSSASSSSKIKLKCCTECPYKSNDSVLLKLHLEMHRHGRTRPFSCNLCSFGCFSAESLHTHLSLHASSTTTESAEGSSNSNGVAPQKNAAANYQCSQCNFRCIELEAFLAHRKEHVQLLQQRLMTIIKRSGNDGNSAIGGMKDKAKFLRGLKTDKQHYCSKCSFHCDSVQAFSLHWEHHQQDDNKFRPGIYRCSICDYNSDTKNIVVFHEKNHHLDVPLAALCHAPGKTDKEMPSILS